MSSDSLYVPCPTCDAKGLVPPASHLAETLALLRGRADSPSGADLARAAGIEPTAMNNRLMHLHASGLAEYREVGRRKLWSATPSGRVTAGADDWSVAELARGLRFLAECGKPATARLLCGAAAVLERLESEAWLQQRKRDHGCTDARCDLCERESDHAV